MFLSLALPTLDILTDVSFNVVVRLLREALLCLEVFDPVGFMFSLLTVPIIPWKGFFSDLSVAAERPGEKVAVFFPVLCCGSFYFPVCDRDLMALLPETKLAGLEPVEEFEA